MFGFLFSWFIGQRGPKVSCEKTQTLPNLRLPISSAQCSRHFCPDVEREASNMYYSLFQLKRREKRMDVDAWVRGFMNGMNSIQTGSRDELYKVRFSRKIDSRTLFSREWDFPMTFSLTENQFSGKTYLDTIASGATAAAARGMSPSSSTVCRKVINAQEKLSVIQC